MVKDYIKTIRDEILEKQYYEQMTKKPEKRVEINLLSTI